MTKKFKLIKQFSENHELLTMVESKCVEVLKDKNPSLLYENAQQFLGSLRAQLAAGKDPGSQDKKTINLLAGLSLLSDPNNWAAANLTNVNAIKTLDLVGRQEDTTSRVSNFGASSASLVAKYQKLLSAAAKGDPTSKQELISDLDRMRLTFSQLKGKVEATAQKPRAKLPSQKQQPTGIIRR